MGSGGADAVLGSGGATTGGRAGAGGNAPDVVAGAGMPGGGHGAGGARSDAGDAAKGEAGTPSGASGTVAASGAGGSGDGRGGTAFGAGGGMSAGGGLGGMRALGGNGDVAGSGSSAMPPYVPCDGKKCGEKCSFCPPGATGCTLDKNPLFCDDFGTCAGGYVNCVQNTPACTTKEDCAITASLSCADGTTRTAEYYCSGSHCLYEFAGCQGSCRNDSDCDTGITGCGECLYGGYACPFAHCNNGVCSSSGQGQCPSDDSCKRKACGDPCTPLCDPSVDNCDPGPAYCDANLACHYSSPPVCGACTTDADCGPGHLCILQVGAPYPNQFHCAVSDNPCGSVDKCSCIQHEGSCGWKGDTAGYCACDTGQRLTASQ